MLADIIPRVAGFEKREGKYGPRPSGAGPERCIRQMVYWSAGIPRDTQVGDRFILTMDDSSWHEELTRDWISKTAYKIIDQQMPFDVSTDEFLPTNKTWISERACTRCGQVVEPNHLHGHSDGALEDMIGCYRAYEHKAINHFAFQRYAGGEWPLDNITQTCLSIVGLQAIIPSVDSGLLLIKNKNTAQYLEFLIKYERTGNRKDTAYILEKITSMGDRQIVKAGEKVLFAFPNVIGGALARFYQVWEYTKNRTLPERPYEYGTNFPCGYCGWEQTCWASYEEEVGAIAKNEADLTELADSARFYNELGGQISDMSNQRDEIGRAIKAKLNELEVRQGTAGEYIIKWGLQKQERAKPKDEIPPELRPMVMKTIITEPLRITKRKPPKEKKQTNGR